jgi:predicted nucleotidyltransferase
MTVSFVTSEFNPFHNGHLKPLIYSKETLKADYCVAVMSSNYVQRGEPALFSKYARAKAALTAGYDMVVELPFYGCLSSSRIFSETAIKTMKKTGVATHFVFGAEENNFNIFDKISSFLCNEPDEYTALFKRNQSLGMTYPKARSEALSSIFKNDPDHSVISDFIEKPNNLLGIDYCIAAKKYAPDLIPVPIKREGGEYHDSSVLSYSAESIRKYIKNTVDHPFFRDFSDLYEVMPDSVAKIFIDELQHNRYLKWEDFSLLLLSRILTLPENNEDTDIIKRIKNMSSLFKNPIDFIELEKTKNITYSSVSRTLLNIMLEIDKNKKEETGCLSSSYPDYIRILGFRSESAELLSSIKKNCEVPLVINTAKDSSVLSGYAKKQFEYEIKISEIWRSAALLKSDETLKNEYQAKYPIKI